MDTINCRQQLSCESKELLERAAQVELHRLRALRDDLFRLQAGPEALARVDAEIAKVDLAMRQLAYVYIDQFEAGREENNRYGRLGLVAMG